MHSRVSFSDHRDQALDQITDRHGRPPDDLWTASDGPLTGVQFLLDPD